MWGLGVGDMNFKKQLKTAYKTPIKKIIILNLQRKLSHASTANGSHQIRKIISPDKKMK